MSGNLDRVLMILVIVPNISVHSINEEIKPETDQKHQLPKRSLLVERCDVCLKGTIPAPHSI